MIDSLNIVKVGGGVLEDPTRMLAFCQGFAKLKGPKVLVHGGGKLATKLGEKLGVPAKMVEGRRITDPETLKIVTMVYAGLANKQVVAQLQALGCNAIGMSGADANAITATRRSPVPLDYGCAGDISVEGVNADLILKMLQLGLTPVFCAIMHDGEGELLNCNADSVAQSVASALAKHVPSTLTFCFEKEGILTDMEDPNSVIPLITPELSQKLIQEHAISDGMIPKVHNAFCAIDQGVKEVCIRSYMNLDKPSGTIISK